MSAVLDASALLSVLLGERGEDIGVPVLRGSAMSAVNISECCARAPERGAAAAAVLKAIERFEIDVVPFDMAQAVRAAELREDTRRLGISLGDRACLALAEQRRVRLFTADERLSRVSIGIEILLIR